MADLGDISGFLKGGSVSNLDWLEVDPTEYRKQDTLPRQNLDAIPDLEAAWAHEDEAAAKYVPNRAGEPRTMGDMSPEHGLLRASPADIRRTARLALMQSDDLRRFKHALTSRYDLDSLQAAKAVIASVLNERGLLGKLYIDSSDFQGCNTGSKKAADFTRRFARDAKFVLAKTACDGCTHAHEGPTGGHTCSTFHKEIQIEVPYSDGLAQEVEAIQQSKGKIIQATAREPRERIRLAMLAEDFVAPGESRMPQPKENVQRLLKPVEAVQSYQKPVDLGPLREMTREVIGSAFREGRLTLPQAQTAYRRVASATSVGEIQLIHEKVGGVEMPEVASYQGAGTQAAPAIIPAAQVQEQLIAASSLTQKRDAEARKFLAAKKAEPVLALLRREMLKGRAEVELVQALKYAFTGPDLEATRNHWEPLFKEAGIFGVVYSTQDSFDECREGSDFLARHNPGIKVLVAGTKCGGCIYNKIGRCLMYGKPLIASPSEVQTQAMVATVLADHKAAGRIAPWDGRVAWGTNPRESLKNIHVAASNTGGASVGQTRDSAVTAFRGNAVQHSLRQDTRREIVTAARKFLNEGLYGRDMLSALKARFESRDLVAAKEDLRPVIAEQGLQGIYFVDPSAYADYGRGCDEAARLHRTRGVPYVKMGSKCGSCVLQTNFHCSKLHKQLVADVPYPADKASLQREILASGPSTDLANPASLVNNGHSVMAEFEVQNRGMEIDLDPIQAHTPYDVSFK